MKEAIKGRMEGKIEIGKPGLLMLDDVKSNQTYENIKHQAIDKEFLRIWIP